ncbi:zinc ribbon domain-containing protein [Duganella sp. FT92W]|uniref:Zinc ribbon domain-containing protein n=1 Tax=Pseudoduganella rivuli TaxID=2666085 RepID=A0A7X2IME9_9BURK|nr:zinc ribbon domain-containing protein [Pseudoduganella rivuli]MRV72534.1 zinc ribbon domain-containing protein [Pseudoduganella rivuli]
MAIAKCRECKTEVSDEAKTCPKCGISKPVKKTSLTVKVLAVLFGIGILGNIIGGISGGTAAKGSAPTSSPPKLDPKEEAIRAINLDKLAWHKGGFDNVMLLSTKIRNDGVHDVKDIEIECVHSSNSGTRIDRNTKVVYEIVKAGKSVNIKEFNMGFVHNQANSTSCRVSDLVLL